MKSWPARWNPERRFLVGVSGGVDSVVLLRCLVEAGYRDLVVCHLNHRLRGTAAEEDEVFVRRLTESMSLPLESGAVDVAVMASETGQSLETAGRAARHAFFAAAAARHGCHQVMLGHHAGDQAETVLLNLCRGSAGLKGMDEETWLHFPGTEPLLVIRPLLRAGKEALLLEAEKQGWPFREDASNASSDFVRNRLRHEVLPLLADIFGRKVSPALVRAEEWSAGAGAFLRDSAAPWASLEKLPAREVRLLPDPLRREVLAGWMRARGVPGLSSAMVRMAERMLFPDSGLAKWNLPGNLFLRRRAGWLWIESVPACGADAD